MKKTLRTVITAAMFAAANLSAMPSSAEQPSPDDQWGWENTKESVFYNPAWDDLEKIASQTQYDMYGAQSVFDVNRHSDDWKNYGWSVP